MTDRRRRALLLLVTGMLTALLVIVISLPPFYDEPWGRVVVEFGDSDEHGLHLADLPAIGCWLVGMLACAALWPRRR